MKVKELIQQLKKFDQDLLVATLEYGFDEPYASSDVLVSIETDTQWSTDDRNLENKQFILFH